MSAIKRYISAAGKFLYPSLLWKKSNSSKVIYLTFDDGPIPGITPWILSVLKEYKAKATFFCIGDNVKKHPEIFKQVLAEGHTVGNHTFNHLNGWKTSTEDYVENVILAEDVDISNINLLKHQITDTGNSLEDGKKRSKLFRPPYGRIKPSQIKKLKNLGYTIVMWDVISEDYDQSKQPEECLKKVIREAVPGSIIVFHDSVKASQNIKAILPQILEIYKKKGYKFRAL